MRYRLFLLVLAVSVVAVSCDRAGSFSKGDLSIIRTMPDSILHVLVIDNVDENGVLRAPSTELGERALKSADFALLSERLVETVSHPSVDGVGIAAPQIGINKRVVAVQRYDKEGFPFEVYPNICIEEYSTEKKLGWEGCLSVPNRREQVLRSEWVIISYTDIATMSTVRDTVKGFSSVIFQHETDHLDGIVYIDRLSEN